MSASPPAAAPREASAARLLAAVVPAMLLVVASADMVNLVLPAMGRDFGASEAELAWVVTGFLLVFAVGIPFYGRLSDRVGLRRLYLLTLSVFAAGSLVCALAPELWVLVLGRVIAGAGGAAVPVLSVVAVTRVLPAEKRGVGLGYLGATGGAAAVAGPVVGGGLGQLLGWPALFWLTVVCALALIPAVVRIVPDDAPGDDHPIDLLGGVLLGLAAGLLLFGVTRAQEAGFGAASAWGALLGGALAAVLFAWRTRRAAAPFVPPSLFADRGFVAAVAVIFLAMAVNLAALVFVPIMAVDVNGLTPGEGSLVMIPGGIALAVVSPVVGALLRRTGARPLVIAGLAVIGASAVLLAATAGASPVFAAAGILGLGAGFASVIAAGTDAAAGSLPADRVGAGMGIFQAAQFLGAGAGPALAGAFLGMRRSAGDALLPWYDGQAPALSDVYLAMTVLIAAALAAALGLARRTAP